MHLDTNPSVTPDNYHSSNMFFDSSEETVNNPQGNNNINNVVVTEPVEIQHDTIEYLMIAITIMKCIELCYVLYRCHQRRMKKRYANNAN